MEHPGHAAVRHLFGTQIGTSTPPQLFWGNMRYFPGNTACCPKKVVVAWVELGWLDAPRKFNIKDSNMSPNGGENKLF